MQGKVAEGERRGDAAAVEDGLRQGIGAGNRSRESAGIAPGQARAAIQARSFPSRCGMAATTAGQATIATKASATRSSCMADSLSKDWLDPDSCGGQESESKDVDCPGYG